jgi:hypothetical protein
VGLLPPFAKRPDQTERRHTEDHVNPPSADCETEESLKGDPLQRNAPQKHRENQRVVSYYPYPEVAGSQAKALGHTEVLGIALAKALDAKQASVRHHHMPSCPAWGVQRPKGPFPQKKKRRDLHLEEVKALLGRIRHHHHETNFERQESSRLKIDIVDLPSDPREIATDHSTFPSNM